MKTAVVFHVPSREAFVLLKVGLDSFLEDAGSHRPTCGLAQPAQDRVGGGAPIPAGYGVGPVWHRQHSSKLLWLMLVANPIVANLGLVDL